MIRSWAVNTAPHLERNRAWRASIESSAPALERGSKPQVERETEPGKSAKSDPLDPTPRPDFAPAVLYCSSTNVLRS